MTKREELSNQIRANTLKLLSLEFNSQEAADLRKEQVRLLTTKLTSSEEMEEIPELDDDGTTHYEVSTRSVQ